MSRESGGMAVVNRHVTIERVRHIVGTSRKVEV